MVSEPSMKQLALEASIAVTRLIIILIMTAWVIVSVWNDQWDQATVGVLLMILASKGAE
jgi:hypothetical protein